MWYFKVIIEKQMTMFPLKRTIKSSNQSLQHLIKEMKMSAFSS